ncbi:hypothetical protein DFG55_14050 [Xanthomonas campestris pv. campestris]|nr:hypothetical protein DFG55_14050 [Xanthomonas campestris pv. campestris]QCX72113.1 hypothetical protein DFG54_16375 [Xanthomonas campestris pv. campestris]RFF60320.1 hypothetical protein D0A36_04995 [Xanthomonas campestris]
MAGYTWRHAATTQAGTVADDHQAASMAQWRGRDHVAGAARDVHARVRCWVPPAVGQAFAAQWPPLAAGR